MANKITYNIQFLTQTQNLKQVQSELQKIASMTPKDLKLVNADLTTQEIKKIQASAQKLEGMLSKSFNVKLNTYDLKQFNGALEKSPGLLQQVQNDLKRLGPQGKIQFNNLTKEVLTMNTQVRQTSNLLDSLGKTFMNTLRWSVASSALNAFSGSIQQAWGYTKKLDTSLNDIRIVTGKSADEMERFAKEANKAAKGLGASTTAYTNASLIYYQQGLGEEDVQARSTVTLKAANVTGQSAAEVSQQLTAVWNGYKVVAEEAELYVDKLAAVAATTAADLEELSDGMSKVASAANTMGVDIDQLSAQLATIVSVTRQDASLVGTALKTIYARMGDLKVSGVDEFGTSLGDVSGQLRQMGIEVLDQEGNLRDMGEVIEEVAAKWGTWTDAQQQAAAVAIAGKRQYNNLIALFENWDMYEGALNTSQTSAGTLQKQQETYMDSLEARLQRLTTAAEKLFDALIDNNAFKGFIDFASGALNVIGDISTGLGGIIPIALSLGGALSKLFNAQITQTLKALGGHVKTLFGAFGDALFRTRAATEQAKESLTNKFGSLKFNTEGAKQAIEMEKERLKNERYLTEEQKQQYELRQKQVIELDNQGQLLKQQQEDAKKAQDDLMARSQTLIQKKGIKDPEKLRLRLENAASVIYGDALTELRNTDLYKNRSERLVGVGKNTTKQMSPADLKTLDKYVKLLGEGTQGQKRFTAALNEFEQGHYDADQVLSILEEALKANEKECKDMAKELPQATEKIKQLGQAAKENSQQMDQATKNFKQFQKNVEKGVKLNTFVDSLASVMQLIGGLQSLASTIKLIGDESVEAEDKIIPVLAGILGGLLSIIPAVVQLGPVVKKGMDAIITGVGGTIPAFEGQGAAAWASLGPYLLIIGAVVAALAMLTGIIIGTTKLFQSMTDNGSKAFEEASKTAQVLADELNRVTEANEELKKSFEDYNNAQKAIEEMTVGTEEWRDAIAEANQQVINLMTKYPELAHYISDVNGQLKISEEGQEKLLAESKKSVAIVQSAALAGERSKLVATNNRIALSAAGKDVENGGLGADESGKRGLWKTIGSVLGLVAGLAMVPFDGGLTAMAATAGLAGGISDLTYAKDANKGYQKAIELINERGTAIAADQDVFTNALKEVGVTNEQVIEALYANREGLIKNAVQVNANTKAMEAMKKQSINTHLATNYSGYENLSTKEQALLTSTLMRTSQSVSVQAATAARRRELAGDNEEVLNKKELKNIANEYAELMGIDPTSIKVDNKSNEITFNLADGSEQKITGEAAVEALVEQFELNTITSGANIETIVAALDRLGNNLSDEFETLGDNFAKAIKTFVSGGSFEDLTKKELTAFIDSVDDYDTAVAEFNAKLDAANAKVDKKDGGWSRFWGGYGKAVDARDKILEEGLGADAYMSFGYASQEEFLADIQAMGFGTEADFIKAIRQEQKNMEREWEKLGLGLSTTVADAFSSIDRSDKSLIFMKNVEKGLASAFTKGGEAGLKAFSNIINTEGLTEENLGAITSIFDEIDWTASGATEEFAQKLAEAGINTAIFGDNWTALIDAMEKAENVVQNVINNLSSLRDILKTISEVTKDLKVGDIISDEEYEKLIAKNKELAKYFVMTPDGYAFVGGEGFNEAVKKAQNNTLNVDKIKEDFWNAELEAEGFLISRQQGGGSYFNEDGTFKGEAGRRAFADSLWGLSGLVAASGGNIDKYQESLGILDNQTILQLKSMSAANLAKQRHANWDSLTKEEQAKLLTEAQNEITSASTQYNNAKSYVDEIVNAAVSNIVAIENGEWEQKSTEAQTVALIGATSNYADLKALNQEYAKSHGGKNIIATEEYNKIARMYLAQEAESVGLFFSEEMLKNANAFDTLAELIVDSRKLELDYLKETSQELDKIGLELDKSFGRERLELIQQQTALLKEQQDENLKQQQRAQNVFASNLLAAQDVSGLDFWDEQTGTFNYQAALDAQANATNETERNAIAKMIADYDKVQEKEQESLELSYELIDAQVSALTYQKEIAEEYRELIKEYREFSTTYSDFLGGSTDFATLFGENFFKDLGKLSNSLTTSDIIGVSNEYSSWLTEAGWDGSKFDLTGSRFYDAQLGTIDEAGWKDFVSNTLSEGRDVFEEMYETASSLYQEVLGANEELLEIYEEQIEKLNNVNTLISESLDLYKLIARQGGNKYLTNVDTFTKNMRDNIAAIYTLAEEEYTKALAAYNALGETADQSLRESAAQALATAQTNQIKALQEALSLTADIFSREIAAAIDQAFVDATGMTLDNFSEDWSREQDLDSMYLDATNSAYESEKMLREFQKSIDKTDNAVAQNKLVQARAEAEARLNKIMEERGKLSQYELDRENALYELTLKQIALEEAQQTANTMKLTRDAFGNYSYQYVSDEDQIAEAEAELAEAQNNLYNLDKEKTSELISNYTSKMQEFTEKYAEAIATGDQGIIDAVYEQYMGENGILTLMRDEITTLSGLDLGTPFEERLDKLAALDWSSLLSSAANITDKAKQDASAIYGQIERMFAEGGSFTTTVEKFQGAVDAAGLEISDQADKAIKTFSGAVTRLSELMTSESFKAFGENLDLWTSKYAEWMGSDKDATGQENSALQTNNTRLQDLNETISELSDTLKSDPELKIKVQMAGGGSPDLTQTYHEVDEGKIY